MWHHTLPPECTVQFRAWLQHQGNLAAAMRQCCADLQLQLVAEQLQRLCAEESQRLGMTKPGLAWVREIILHADNTPWTLGRVVIPEADYRRQQVRFDTLQQQFIGQALLYSDPALQRSGFEYQRLDQSAALLAHYPINAPKHCWARRSLFTKPTLQLLLTEVILPSIASYPGLEIVSPC